MAKRNLIEKDIYGDGNIWEVYENDWGFVERVLVHETEENWLKRKTAYKAQCQTMFDNFGEAMPTDSEIDQIITRLTR